MWLNVFGQRENGACAITWKRSLISRANSLTLVLPAGSKSTCSSMSNIENTIWRSVPRPLWKFFAASILSKSARGSASPVSTCDDIDFSTSHSQQKFSMNCDGSSTASHSTPLMPDTPISSTRVSM